MNIRFHEIEKPNISLRSNPKCTCGKPIGIVLKPGQHIHPCPVHPDKFITGPNIIYWS